MHLEHTSNVNKRCRQASKILNEIKTYMQSIERAVTNAQKRQNISGNREVKSSNYNKTSTLYGSYNLMQKTSNKRENKNTFNQAQARTNGKCVFCKGQIHKFQLYCSHLN